MQSGKAQNGSEPARWSQRVTTTSNALDLEPGVFSYRSARSVAASLKRSAERSRRRKGTPFQSAMSMLTFYINRYVITLLQVSGGQLCATCRGRTAYQRPHRAADRGAGAHLPTQ